MPTMSTVLRSRSAFCVVLTILGTVTVAARKAPDLLEPAGPVAQSVLGQSLDAFIVESANKALLEYAALSAPKQKRLAHRVDTRFQKGKDANGQPLALPRGQRQPQRCFGVTANQMLERGPTQFADLNPE